MAQRKSPRAAASHQWRRLRHAGFLPVVALVALVALVAMLGARCSRKPKATDTESEAEKSDTVTELFSTETATGGFVRMVGDIAIDPTQYPASLLDFMEKYPEATQFVLDYPTAHTEKPSMDISGDLAAGGYPHFLQWDKRWGYEMYGDDYMAVNGCGPTCLSMVYCGLTGKSDQNPYQVAKMAEQNGYFVDGVGSSWDLMDEGAQKLGLTAEKIENNLEARITSALRSEEPVICSVGEGDFTYEGHFIVLSGILDDGSIQVLDPNSNANTEKTWEMDRLLPQIAGAWAYRARNAARP